MSTTSRRTPIKSRQLQPPDPGPIPPDAGLVRQRWIPRLRREWVYESDRIMMQYGSVQGSKAYANRHNARWRAQALIRLMVELRVHERWELREHTEAHGNGWIWSVEYVGRHGEGSSNA